MGALWRVKGEEVETCGEVGGGEGDLRGVEGDGEDFMACGVVE